MSIEEAYHKVEKLKKPTTSYLLSKSTRRFNNTMLPIIVLLYSLICEISTLTNGQCVPRGNVEYGVSIVEDTIITLNRIGFQQCIKECKRTQDCLSVDFNRDAYICDLKSKLLKDTNTITKPNAWNWHIDMDKVPIVSDCDGFGCSMYDKCIKDSCIPSGCPSTIKYSEASPTDGLSCGGERSFKCLEGYTGRGNPIANSLTFSNNDFKCYKTDGEWILLARFMAGIGSPVLSTWLSAGTSSESDASVEEGCSSMNFTANCTKHYRTSLVDEWETLNITEVKIELFEVGVMVANIHFKGNNTDKESWFSIDKYLSSGWTDINTGQTFLFFDIYGEIGVSRWFYIVRNHNGCENDAGWLAISEGDACSYEDGAKPIFFYSPLDTYCTGWSHYKKADVMAISVKASNFP